MATSHWFIGGGAEHTAEMVRQETYASQGGAEGIVEPADLRVLPLDIPGAGVRVTIGSGFMKAGNAGAHNEMYMGSVVTQEIVDVPANTGTNTRTDLIVMRVHDPYWQGSPWPDPGAGIVDPEEAEEARAHAKYVFIERIGSVPANTTRLQNVVGYENDTAITLARLSIPASTGTVIASMITSLREVSRPRRHEVVFARPRLGADDGPNMYLNAATATGGEYFPGGNGVPNEFQVDVPDWATHMVVEASWMTVFGIAGKDPYGNQWMEYGTEWRDKTWPGNQHYEFSTQHFGFNYPQTNDVKSADWKVMDMRPVPAKMRGKRATFVFKAGLRNHITPPTQKTVYMNSYGGLGCRITFAQQAIESSMV